MEIRGSQGDKITKILEHLQEEPGGEVKLSLLIKESDTEQLKSRQTEGREDFPLQ